MPSAATTFDDYGFDAPAPRKGARKPRSGGKGKKAKPARFRFDKLSRYAAIAMSCAIAVGILVNALMMQKGSHPAPLFGKAVVASVAPPAAEPKRLAEEPTAEAAPKPAVAMVTAPAASKPKRQGIASRDASEAGDDAIARLLNGAGTPAPAATDKTVLGVQKALAKLGFATKANGVMTASTRKAIEAFEKSRSLPVNGEMNHRVIKALAAESGLRIE